MKLLLAFCLLLGMSAQGQDPCQFAKLYDGALVDEAPHCVLLNQLFIHATALDDITRAEFAQAAQRAADETDGSGVHLPFCKNSHDYNCITKPPPEPVDVPAVHEKAGYFICDSPPLYGNSSESPHSCRIQRYKWKCKDTSRVLLTSEDGKKHCVKF